MANANPRKLYISFEDWMKAVDAALIAKIGLKNAELPDCQYTQWHKDGVSPAGAARKAILYTNGHDD